MYGHISSLLLHRAVASSCKAFVYFQTFCLFAQSQLLIKINRLTEELSKANTLNYRELKHCVSWVEEMFVLMSDTQFVTLLKTHNDWKYKSEWEAAGDVYKNVTSFLHWTCESHF